MEDLKCSDCRSHYYAGGMGLCNKRNYGMVMTRNNIKSSDYYWCKGTKKNPEPIECFKCLFSTPEKIDKK